jgi:MFS transporter, AAHS family, 4-hydroxybenzoate transporter
MALIDVAQLIDQRRLGWFNWKVVLFGFFLTLFEGFDGGTVAYVSPVIVKEWGITDMKALGFTFSLGLAATFIGAPLFGWIADRTDASARS